MAKINKSQLIKLQSKYVTDDAIGKLYGISRQAVHQLRNAYGIPPVEEKHKAAIPKLSSYTKGHVLRQNSAKIQTVDIPNLSDHPRRAIIRPLACPLLVHAPADKIDCRGFIGAPLRGDKSASGR